MDQSPEAMTRTAELETSERFLNLRVTLLGLCYFLASLMVIYFGFVGLAPARSLTIWAILALSVALITVGFIVSYVVRRPSIEETIRLWRPLDQRLPQLFDLVLIAAIFLLFPYADAPREVLMTAYCVGYVPSQILSDPENTRVNQLSAVGILGSFALQLALRPGWHSDVLAFLVVAYGVVMFIAAGSLRDIVHQAVEARQKMEVVVGEREEALKSVSAERDARTKFLAAASHDLGQPLHATTLFLEGAVDAKTASERMHSLEKASFALTSARAMVGDMLSYARLEADAVAPTLRPVALDIILKGVCELFGPMAAQHALAIRYVATSKVMTTDAALLKRALSNLISNAITHSCGTKIVVGVRQRHENRLTFYVIDNGIGIPPSDHELIFNDFYQCSRQDGLLSSGFGLGLASVQRIVVLLGGKVTVKVLPTSGACFMLEMPFY